MSTKDAELMPHTWGNAVHFAPDMLALYCERRGIPKARYVQQARAGENGKGLLLVEFTVYVGRKDFINDQRK